MYSFAKSKKVTTTTSASPAKKYRNTKDDDAKRNKKRVIQDDDDDGEDLGSTSEDDEEDAESSDEEEFEDTTSSSSDGEESKDNTVIDKLITKYFKTDDIKDIKKKIMHELENIKNSESHTSTKKPSTRADKCDKCKEKEKEKSKGKGFGKGKEKYNIIMTMGDYGDEDDEDDDDYDSEYDESDEESESDEDKESENEDASVSSCSTGDDYDSDAEVLDEKDKEDAEFLDKIKEMTKATSSKYIQKYVKKYESGLKKKKYKQVKMDKKIKERNLRIFKKSLKSKTKTNDPRYFKKHMNIEQQKKVIKQMREINKLINIEKPYRLNLLELDIPVSFKTSAFKKIHMLKHMDPTSQEYYKVKNWIDTFMLIPFNRYEKIPVSIDDGVEKCQEFMRKSQEILDSAVYGMTDAKIQVMQLLGQLIINPASIGTAIAIHGKYGCGKTSLVKEGISKILNRPFVFIALGGATDSSFLEGHSYTYEGSTWGKIVQILIQSKCMNPVIYFDELDKVSDTSRGEEIINILTHLTDTSQNSHFHDKYFTEIDFDLSQCLFIFSYNDEKKVNPILLDRMYKIQTKGYDRKEKIVIANNYLLPKIREQVKFEADQVILPDETLGHIIEYYCNNEDGVRNLKRCLETIFTKLNLFRLMKSGDNMFEKEIAIKAEFPIVVTKDIVDKLLKLNREDVKHMHMYI